VSRSFGEVQALSGMSMRAAHDEVVAVVGPSGCGKSTLLELICGLQQPDSGTVASAPAALMPQRDLLLPWLTALDNAGLALRARGVSKADARASAAPWLERFGLAGFERARPAGLSGGMRQRVSFLRTLLAGKPVLALDEPFAALDAITRAEMQAWLGHVLELEPRTVVLVTHDVEEAVVLADRVVVMSPRPGRTVAEIAIELPRPRRRVDPAESAGGERMTRWLLPAALLAALLGAWELYVDLGGVDPVVLPAPHGVASALFDDRSLLWSNFLVTAKEVLLGILVAAIVGLALAIAIHFSDTLRRAIYPLLIASQAIPIVVLAPILLTWLGFGLLPKLVVIALVSFFSIVVTTLAGLAAVDPDLLKLMRTFDAPRRRTFWHVELPSALPGVFTGTRIAVVVSVIGAVFAEWNGSNSGLGYLILISTPQLLTARAVAAVVILCIFAVVLFGLLTLAERVAVPWAYQPRGDLSR
jgi:ABC-type nitrate/sulfonate/bicarbonate transport system ATPase subunit/ABC-type nitrate/sulfonate/bicarbonate transport system permease component